MNGPGSVVVSGGVDGLDEFVALCGVEGVDARRVAVDYASHSVLVEGLAEEVVGLLGSVVAGRGVCRCIRR